MLQKSVFIKTKYYIVIHLVQTSIEFSIVDTLCDHINVLLSCKFVQV